MSNSTNLQLGKYFLKPLLIAGASIVLATLVWQGFTSAGNPDPTVAHLGYGGGRSRHRGARFS